MEVKGKSRRAGGGEEEGFGFVVCANKLQNLGVSDERVFSDLLKVSRT